MALSTSSSGVLEALPSVSRGRVGVYLVDPTGSVVHHFGFDDGVDPRQLAADATSATPPGRRAIERTLGTGGDKLIVTFADDQTGFLPFFEYLFMTLIEKDQLELDMESMYSSSLALLEEVSMVGDVMSRLSTGRTEKDVVQIGLEALLVAASARSAAYVRYLPEQGLWHELVRLVMDDESLRPVEVPVAEDVPFAVEDGVIFDAIQSPNDALIVQVPPDGRLGRTGSPEHLAAREVLAVPVRCGDEDDRATLGVIVVLDKRANSYSNVVTFGSQESKLATNIASMVGSALGNRLIAEYGKELKLANEIQQQILPHEPAQLTGFDLSGRCEISGSVGGDYFDFLPMADGRMLAFIADVSGHNLASGMLMVSARSILKLLASKHDDPARIFDDLQANLFDDLQRTERFITAAGIALRPGIGRIEIVNAGHNDTMVYRAATQTVERVSSTDTVLGFLPGTAHDTTSVDLAPDDVVLVYTDGVSEAVNDAGEMLGEDRLAETLTRVSEHSASTILAAVFSAVEEFSAVPEKDDDVTVVVIKRSRDHGGAS